MANNRHNKQVGAGADRVARDKRIAKAKAKINELVDAGTSFNPQTASQHTIDRAVANMEGGQGTITKRNREAEMGRGGRADDIKKRRVNSARSPRKGRN
jgi:hypothetical protein